MQKEVAFSWTMWYSTVKLLEIGTFAMQWITAGGAPVFPSRLRFFIRQLA
ncbi:MAG: hypothetical protein ACLTTF_09050 [Oscillospiraceae bacterium]